MKQLVLLSLVSTVGCGVAVLPASAQTPSPESTQAAPARAAAVLQTLDKITGRVRTVDAPIDETIRFGALAIVARTCRKRPPEEPPESAAFLEIAEVKPGEAPRDLFRGWMFASSPAVSALEHPVYDVWVIDCKMASPSPSSAR
ncbi:MAG: DUF2155 domain-containing protein [Rhodospirillales bacterium]|nr:DUF2155 domain-containing protein [Rhodospirillales bacterium]